MGRPLGGYPPCGAAASLMAQVGRRGDVRTAPRRCRSRGRSRPTRSSSAAPAGTARGTPPGSRRDTPSVGTRSRRQCRGLDRARRFPPTAPQRRNGIDLYKPMYSGATCGTLLRGRSGEAAVSCVRTRSPPAVHHRCQTVLTVQPQSQEHAGWCRIPLRPTVATGSQGQ